MPNAHFEHAHPKYGFEWGPMRVTRMTNLPRYHVLVIDTEHRHVQVAVSPTGRSVRVWVDGLERVAELEREANRG